jgi:hypothetical protein
MRRLIKNTHGPAHAFLKGALALGAPMLSFPIILIVRLGGLVLGRDGILARRDSCGPLL